MGESNSSDSSKGATGDFPRQRLARDHLEELLEITKQAAEAVLEVYNSSSIHVELKDDQSPLTEADIRSHRILSTGLSRITPSIPVGGEEMDQEETKVIVQKQAFWLVDGLDGTKEFLNRSGDFTVCLGLVEDGLPTFGIIAAPALGITYYGGPGMGSFKIDHNTSAQAIHISPHKLGIILGSRSHQNEATAEYVKQYYPGATVEAVGSQLKLPYIAEGKADACPRLGTSMKLWDLAAGHAILLGAGGSMKRPDGSAIDYHAQDLLTGDFVASS